MWVLEVRAVFLPGSCSPKELRGGPMKEKLSVHWRATSRASAVCTKVNRTRHLLS